MDSEKPHSIGSIATRIVCTLVGFLVLYLLTYPLASYLVASSSVPMRISDLIVLLYQPLLDATNDTPLALPIGRYTEWVFNLLPEPSTGQKPP